MKISIINIMAFIIYHIIFVTFSYVDNYNVIVLALEILMLFLLCLKIKVIINKKFAKINILLIAFIFIIFIGAIRSGSTFMRGIIFGIKVLEIFIFCEYAYQKNKIDSVIKTFFYLTLFYVIITDILLISVPSLFMRYNNYFVGNKFYVSYLHILLFTFYMCLPKKNKRFTIILYAYSIIISIIVNCNTALIGTILIALLYLLKDRFNLVNPALIIIVILVSSSILFMFRGILNYKPIQFFIVEILNEDLTLTGRLEIYDNDLEIISKKLFLGYGYGNSHDVMYDAIKAPNTQNGLLECVLNFGVLGTFILLLIIYNVFKNYDKNKNKIPLIIYIYAFSILGMVEVTINITYIAVIALINNGLIKEKGEDCGNIENKEYNKKCENGYSITIHK